MNSCIMCGSDQNLNTKLTIVIDNQNIIVALCDLHAEETTVKMAREKYQERLGKINELVEQAKRLGLDASSLLGKPTPQADRQPEHRQNNAAVSSAASENDESQEEGWISTDRYDTIDNRGFTSTGGQGVQSYSSYRVAGQEDVLDGNVRQGKVKMGIIEGREGSPVPVPVVRVDGTGTTKIRIIKTDDQALQKRFKRMASSPEQPDFRHGYSDSTRTCPICHGDCSINGKDCPKCQGTGLISVY